MIKNPTEPGYINYYIAQLKRKKMKYCDELHRINGIIAGIETSLRQIKEDTDASIAMADKEAEAVQTEAAQEKIKALEKESERQAKPIPVHKKKRGPSSIETLAPPIKDTKKKTRRKA